MLWSEFCLGGYFRHAVYYAIIEALILSRSKIKKVYLSVLGRHGCKIKVKDDTLTFEAASFLRLPVYPAGFILLGNTFWYPDLFWAGAWYSSCAFECKLFFGRKVQYGPSFLEKYIFLFPFSSIFLNFIINDSIFGIVSIHNDSSGRIMPLLLALA